MSNRFYATGEQRAAKVGDLFARVAPRYDLINDLQSFGLHRRWKQRLVRLAEVQPGQRALDLCCGTGDIAFALARAGAEVVGLDFSEPMLSVARQRLQVVSCRLGVGAAKPTVQFLPGNAQAIPFPDNSFSVVTVGYGLRNLASWQAGLSEMRRVARPGGRLLVLDFGKPDNTLWRRLYFGYLKLFVPVLGRIVCGSADAYAYILESLKDYPAQQGVAAEMSALNLTQIKIINLLGGAMSINCGTVPER